MKRFNKVELKEELKTQCSNFRRNKFITIIDLMLSCIARVCLYIRRKIRCTPPKTLDKNIQSEAPDSKEEEDA